jgi:hypothetical protein
LGNIHWAIKPHVGHCIGQASARSPRIGHHIIWGIGEPQNRTNATIAYHYN